MGFIVKTTTNGKDWSFCFATEATLTSKAVNIQSPYVVFPSSEKGECISLHSGKHVWERNQGWCLTFENKSLEEIHSSPSLRYPKWIPEHIQKSGFESVVRYAISSTPVSVVFARPEVRRAIAEDLVLDKKDKYLRSPVTLPPTDELLEEWGKIRPDAYKFACEDADRVSESFGPLKQLRRKLRLEAHRKIDASVEKFMSTPCLGGDVWFNSPYGNRYHYGRIKSVAYPMGEMDAKVSPLAENQELLTSIENTLLPGNLTLAERLTLLSHIREFASWEEANPLPSIGYYYKRVTLNGSPYFSDMGAPKGFIRRDEMKEPASNYSSLGISCFISEPAARFIKTVEVPDLTPEEAAQIGLKRAWSEKPVET